MKQTSRTRMMLAATFFALFATLVLTERCRADSFTDALDAPGLVWTNVGSWPVGWGTGGAEISHDGVDGAMSSLMLLSEGYISSTLQTVVTGPCLVSCWWKLDTNFGLGGLGLYIDGESAGGWPNYLWSQYTVGLSSGNHILLWVHVLMVYPPPPGWPGGPAGGYSYAYLDQVVVTPVNAPMITVQPQNQIVSPGTNAAFTVQAIGASPLIYQWYLNGTNALPAATNAILSLTNVQVAQNGNYQVVISNSFGITNSSVALLAVLDSGVLASALDTTNLTWSTGGNCGWYGQAVTTHDSVDAAQSGPITYWQQSWMQTTLTGPGTLIYWWKVSSATNANYLYFYLDGVIQSGFISGTVDWQKRTNSIAAGPHIVMWCYSKNGTSSSGQDAGWVDEVSYISRPSIITTNGSLGFSNGLFGFNVSGSASQTLVIEGSTNLLNWTPLQTNVMGGSPVYFSDDQWTNYPGRFYRVRLP